MNTRYLAPKARGARKKRNYNITLVTIHGERRSSFHHWSICAADYVVEQGIKQQLKRTKFILTSTKKNVITMLKLDGFSEGSLHC